VLSYEEEERYSLEGNVRGGFFEMRLDLLTGKTNTMGLHEQITEMRVKEVEEKTSRLFVKNLLKESDFSLEKIASLANVSLEFVKKVKARIRR